MTERKRDRKPRDAPKAAARRHRNAEGAQRQARDAQPGTRQTGDDERIAERRAKALVLRKAGASYRAIARECEVDVATAWSDVQTELAELRQVARETAEDVKQIELGRLDDWTIGLTNRARQGDEKAVRALVQVSQRRARLLGLDAPIGVAIDPSGLSDDELAALTVLLRKATGRE